MRQPAVEVVRNKGGQPFCVCHGWSVRWINRKDGTRELIHCEHPTRYVEYGDGYIPDYCGACGWRA